MADIEVDLLFSEADQSYASSAQLSVQAVADHFDLDINWVIRGGRRSPNRPELHGRNVLHVVDDTHGQSMYPPIGAAQLLTFQNDFGNRLVRLEEPNGVVGVTTDQEQAAELISRFLTAGVDRRRVDSWRGSAERLQHWLNQVLEEREKYERLYYEALGDLDAAKAYIKQLELNYDQLLNERFDKKEWTNPQMLVLIGTMVATALSPILMYLQMVKEDGRPDPVAQALEAAGDLVEDCGADRPSITIINPPAEDDTASGPKHPWGDHADGGPINPDTEQRYERPAAPDLPYTAGNQYDYSEDP